MARTTVAKVPTAIDEVIDNVILTPPADTREFDALNLAGTRRSFDHIVGDVPKARISRLIRSPRRRQRALIAGLSEQAKASQNQLPISGKGSLADISLNPVDVRFGSKAHIQFNFEGKDSRTL
jgi:hypothetical protein